MNLLTFDGGRYLVAPRGTTQWVRNLRAWAAASCGSVGTSRCSVRPKWPTPTSRRSSRAYLKRWKFEVGAFFDGVDAKSSDTELRRISVDHPIFSVEEAA